MNKNGTDTFPKELFVLYDGVCSFCISVIGFILKKDKLKAMQFKAIQSIEGRAILRSNNESFINLKTIYFIKNGVVNKKSKAIFKIFSHLKLPWKMLSWFSFLPEPITDSMYLIVARYRHRIFPKNT